jgi:hypothetical protein
VFETVVGLGAGVALFGAVAQAGSSFGGERSDEEAMSCTPIERMIVPDVPIIEYYGRFGRGLRNVAMTCSDCNVDACQRAGSFCQRTCPCPNVKKTTRK